jgi:hypothetical protein
MGWAMTFSLPGFDLDAFVAATLAEDLGVGQPGGGRDVTAESVIPAAARFSGDRIAAVHHPGKARSTPTW